MTGRLLTTLAIAAAIAAPAPLAAAAPASPAARGADTVLREATRLASQWGRCPTARPAHAALRVARHATGARRAPAARRARDAWRGVAVVCSQPVPMPVAVPGA